VPVYSFKALTPEGATRKGIIEADTAKNARAMLRAQALVPLDVEPVASGAKGFGATGSGWNTQLWSTRVFGATALAIWTRQIAGLVVAGLPLERALTALADEAETQPQRNLVASLRAEVNGGTAFAVALAQHPREFPATYCAVVGAGEQSGDLGVVLERLADDLEQSQELKSQLVGAALYPAIVTLVAIAIVMFLLGYVVPQVAQVFAGSKRALPLLTVVMLGLAGFIRNQAWLILFAIVLIAFCARVAWASATFREKFDAGWLNVPILGKLASGYNAARFASTLAMLAAAGVPILKALQAAAETLSNRAMRADAIDALALVREGAPLASALAQKKRFPSLLSMFARLGEQTGQLPVMLDRAARQLGTQVQRRALQLATLLEPLLIVAMGLVVMLIVLAVMLPIIQLNQLAK
jgi:general secretion pathway protein F